MSSFKKLTVAVAAGVALCGVAYAGLSSTYTGSPSQGATIVGHGAAADGNGRVYANGNADVGYKVWVATDTNAHQLADEASNVAVAGLIHSVCVSSGTAGEWAVVYDSATTANITVANAAADALIEVTAPVVRTATQVNCQTYDAQFWNGAVILQTGNTLGATTSVYWRPARGGSN